jgi:hypothetical protein
LLVNTVEQGAAAGEDDASIVNIGGGEFQGCRPIYSSTEPITVYAVVTYQVYQYMGYGRRCSSLTWSASATTAVRAN